jgi:hypothetical protein
MMTANEAIEALRATKSAAERTAVLLLIIEERTASAHATQGRHDARVAMLARERSGKDTDLRVELKALCLAPRAYADAFLAEVERGLEA